MTDQHDISDDQTGDNEVVESVSDVPTEAPSEPEVSPEEIAALTDEQNRLDLQTQKFQIQYLTQRLSELARENALLKAGSK